MGDNDLQVFGNFNLYKTCNLFLTIDTLEILRRKLRSSVPWTWKFAITFLTFSVWGFQYWMGLCNFCSKPGFCSRLMYYKYKQNYTHVLHLSVEFCSIFFWWWFIQVAAINIHWKITMNPLYPMCILRGVEEIFYGKMFAHGNLQNNLL